MSNRGGDGRAADSSGGGKPREFYYGPGPGSSGPSSTMGSTPDLSESEGDKGKSSKTFRMHYYNMNNSQSPQESNMYRWKIVQPQSGKSASPSTTPASSEQQGQKLGSEKKNVVEGQQPPSTGSQHYYQPGHGYRRDGQGYEGGYEQGGRDPRQRYRENSQASSSQEDKYAYPQPGQHYYHPSNAQTWRQEQPQDNPYDRRSREHYQHAPPQGGYSYPGHQQPGAEGPSYSHSSAQQHNSQYREHSYGGRWGHYAPPREETARPEYPAGNREPPKAQYGSYERPNETSSGIGQLLDVAQKSNAMEPNSNSNIKREPDSSSTRPEEEYTNRHPGGYYKEPQHMYGSNPYHGYQQYQDPSRSGHYGYQPYHRPEAYQDHRHHQYPEHQSPYYYQPPYHHDVRAGEHGKGSRTEALTPHSAYDSHRQTQDYYQKQQYPPGDKRNDGREMFSRDQQAHYQHPHDTRMQTDPRQKLESFLGRRPSKEDLVRQNILSDSKVAPALQGAETELKKRRRRSSLSVWIQERPTKQQLVDRNILSPSSRTLLSPSGTPISPQRQRTVDALKAKIENNKQQKQSGLSPTGTSGPAVKAVSKPRSRAKPKKDIDASQNKGRESPMTKKRKKSLTFMKVINLAQKSDMKSAADIGKGTGFPMVLNVNHNVIWPDASSSFDEIPYSLDDIKWEGGKVDESPPRKLKRKASKKLLGALAKKALEVDSELDTDAEGSPAPVRSGKFNPRIVVGEGAEDDVADVEKELGKFDIHSAPGSPSMSTDSKSSKKKPSPLRPKGSKDYNIGSKVEALDSEGEWFAARVRWRDVDEGMTVSDKEEMVLIHYEGYGCEYDEWLPIDRIKRRGKNAAFGGRGLEEDLRWNQIKALLNSHRTSKTGIICDGWMMNHECTCSRAAQVHPESPMRLTHIMGLFEAENLLDLCKRVRSQEINKESLELVHSSPHVKTFAYNTLGVPPKDIEVMECGGAGLATDTVFNEEYSPLAARLSAGCLVALTEKVVKGELSNGFAVIRPPGHHAEEDQAMGFCFFNNVAVASAVAREQLGVKKVLIIDWDIHHGNGTQNIFYEDPNVLYVSLHRYDDGNFYPYTGKPTDCGELEGLGTNINIPWNGGIDPAMGNTEYLAALRHIILPIAEKFGPDLTFVSAGFDAAEGDDMGGYRITPEGYAHMTSEILKIGNGKVILALEGGYDLASLPASASGCLKVLLGQKLPLLPKMPIFTYSSYPPNRPYENALEVLKNCLEIQQKHWDIPTPENFDLPIELYEKQPRRSRSPMRRGNSRSPKAPSPKVS
eukprot:Nk52_evm6s2192 gene=Nk52_evmTU6s2192